MARPRMKLQLLLEQTTGHAVYFQPPENVRISYPATIYHRDRSWDVWADNGKYLLYKGYIVTYCSENPDDPALDRLEYLPLCSYERHYEADGLNHDVFLIYH